MKLGEKLKYKARRYLYQLEQEANLSGKKMQKDNEKSQNNPLKQKHSKSYDEYSQDKYDKYDVYTYQNLYSNSDSNNAYSYKEPMLNKEKAKGKNIIDALDEMEEYLEEQFDKIKK